mgnify:CR=1 FL=1
MLKYSIVKNSLLKYTEYKNKNFNHRKIKNYSLLLHCLYRAQIMMIIQKKLMSQRLGKKMVGI